MKTVDITTTQNVTIQYELAGLRERLLSFVLDIVILYISIFILTIGYSVCFSGAGMSYFSYFVIIPIATFYTFASEQLLDGQTIGKRALRIKVVKLDGKPLTTSDHFLRWTMRLVDIWFSSGLIAGVLVSSSTQCQRLGDLATNTSVIKLNSSLRFSLFDILNISSLSDYVPQYAEVRRMNEQDMVLIKNAIIRADRYRNDAHELALTELTVRVCTALDIQQHTVRDSRRFLQTILKDYIVLTR
ncbi:MAG: hypothetical protein RI894_2481 [Bacteroidota bacterium]|jgi:uncharacterized RDD family membrane protein YckC